MEEPITIEYKGKTYHGKSVVRGKRKLYQTIYYGKEYKEDGHPYRPSEEASMRSAARIILREIIEEIKKGIRPY